MLIGGINTLTLLDYPGKVACILFTVGCNFRCGYCHNPQFVSPAQIKHYRSTDLIPEKKFFSFLSTRQGLLDGVVISGGEPTIQPDLIPFIQEIRKMGFLVKLDSNGSHPQVLKLLLQKKLVDYIAMDVKASPTKYSEICDTSIDFELIDQSRDLIMNSGIDHEFRTTLLSPFHDLSEVEAIAHFCKGAQKYTIQNFRPQKVLNPSFSRYQGLDKSTLIKMEAIASKFIDQVVVLD